MDSRSVLRIAGALALALLLVLPAAAADPGRIAFVSTRDGNTEIYVMDGDGSNVTRLTNDGAADFCPAWSPDGSRIAFVSDRERVANQSPNLHIFTMRPDGTDVARLNDSLLWESDPAWSPDGTRIAFRDGDIWVVNADGSNPVRLTNDGATDAYGPAWSPDGARIAYANCTWSPPEPSTTIWTIRADGTGQSPLGAAMTLSGRDGLSWSPDGTRIVYSRQGLGIRVMNADGSGDAAIPGGNTGDLFPSWSPDGTRIVFVSDRDGHPEICVMDPDGSNRTTLDAGAGNNYDPAWGVTYPPGPPLVPVSPSALPPTDPDGDGVYDDVNGNGHADFADVVLFFNALDWIADNEPINAFDCNTNGRIDFADVVRLFNHL